MIETHPLLQIAHVYLTMSCMFTRISIKYCFFYFLIYRFLIFSLYIYKKKRFLQPLWNRCMMYQDRQTKSQPKTQLRFVVCFAFILWCARKVCTILNPNITRGCGLRGPFHIFFMENHNTILSSADTLGHYFQMPPI